MVLKMTDEIKANSKAAFETLRRVLNEIGWDSEPDEENASFYIDFGFPHLPVSEAVAGIAPAAECFLLYINIGPSASPERRDEVERFITLVNWELATGNFEMDRSDGHVRFRTGVDFRNTELPEALIRSTILAAMSTIEVFADALVDVVAREKSAQRAFRELKTRQV